MQTTDSLLLSFRTLANNKMRSGLTALGLIIGIAAVVILTSIGRGIHHFVLAEFTQFGTHLIAVFPGKTSTFGISGATISTLRPLTQADAISLSKLDNISAAVPFVQGNARIETSKKQRRASVFGVGPAVPEVWKIKVEFGKFLPAGEQRNPRSFAVLGHKLYRELFGQSNALGQRVRIGTDRFRIIGVMEKKGQMLGFDLDDSIYIPAEKALALFNRESLMEIDLLYQKNSTPEKVVIAIKKRLIARHGHEDFTVVTQNQMLETMSSVLDILTLAVAALGGISLLVGSVGILTIMTIAVSERISEIGLLRAIGAEQRDIFFLFLYEALALSVAGGVLGIAFGLTIVQSIKQFIPALPVQHAWVYIFAAFGISLLVGIIAGVAPAIKAAGLEPLEALRTE